jgi:16S rRNA processing protein RimM
LKDEKVLLGTINGLFGVKGWVKVFSHTTPRHKIVEYKHWYLGDDQGQLVKVEQGRAQKNTVVAKLEKIDDRDAAIAILNQKIWVDAKQLAVLPDNEYYWFQLIGLEVFDSANKRIGIIRKLMETGANDVLIVCDEKNKEHLIPYIQEQVVKTIDLETKCMVVDWDTEY